MEIFYYLRKEIGCRRPHHVRTQFFFVATTFLNKGRNPNEEVTELQKHNRLAHSRKSEILVEGVKNKIKNEKKNTESERLHTGRTKRKTQTPLKFCQTSMILGIRTYAFEAPPIKKFCGTHTAMNDFEVLFPFPHGELSTPYGAGFTVVV